jgi:1-acyl-sn-glycerol-3-phosphate acyltransferase
MILDPLLLVVLAIVVVALPLWLVVAAFVSRYVPGKWRPLRIAWFIFLYLLIEVVSLIAMFFMWIGSGFGWKLRSDAFRDAHYALFGWMLRRVVNSALKTFKINLVAEGERPQAMGASPLGRTRSVLVCCRHAGPGDSILLMNGLYNTYHRHPRIVMKEFLQWDPAVDVMLNRLPVAFVPVGRKGGDALLEAIGDLAASMDADDAYVIFPEGANFTERRRARAIEKLAEIGRTDLAERAKDLKETLPPRSTGVKVALDNAPENTDVFFVGHAGLESFVTVGDIWQGMPMDTEVHVKIWHVPAEELPVPEDQESWLFDVWADIDTWVTSRLELTA